MCIRDRYSWLQYHIVIISRSLLMNTTFINVFSHVPLMWIPDLSKLYDCQFNWHLIQWTASSQTCAVHFTCLPSGVFCGSSKQLQLNSYFGRNTGFCLSTYCLHHSQNIFQNYISLSDVRIKYNNFSLFYAQVPKDCYRNQSTTWSLKIFIWVDNLPVYNCSLYNHKITHNKICWIIKTKIKLCGAKHSILDIDTYKYI